MTLSTYETAVRPEWIDYNGHLSEAFYVLVFGFATDEAMAALGLGEEYRSHTACSLYTVEAHVRYLDEVGLGSDLRVATDVVGVTAKKLHLAHTMVVDGRTVATEELLALHVDQNRGRAVALPESVESAARAALAEAPSWAGRCVGQPT